MARPQLPLPQAPAFDRSAKSYLLPQIVFFHTVFLEHNSIFSKSAGIFNKLTLRDKNINATLAEVAATAEQAKDFPRVNIYANTRYKNLPSLVFDKDVFMMVYWPANINSSSYNFSVRPDLKYPARVEDMAKWQGSNARAQGLQPYRPQFTIAQALEKNREIHGKVMPPALDDSGRPIKPSPLRYLDDSGARIIDRRKKFEAKAYRNLSAESSREEIPERELRHNESHIQACFANVKDVALVRDNYDLDSSTDIIELLSAISLRDQVKKRKRDILDDKSLLEQELGFFQKKSEELTRAIAHFNTKLSFYQKDLGANERYDASYVFNDDLLAAFERKKQKYPGFAVGASEVAKRNRETWLKNNIAKTFDVIHQLELELEKNKKIDEQVVIGKLSSEVHLTRYDKASSTLAIAPEDKYQKEGLCDRLLQKFLLDPAKNSDMLHKMILNQIEMPLIQYFLEGVTAKGIDLSPLLLYRDAQTNKSLLATAAQNGYVAAAEMLLTRYPQQAIASKGQLGLAISYDQAEMVELLTSKGVAVDASSLDLAIDSNAQRSATILFSKYFDEKKYLKFGGQASEKLFEQFHPYFINSLNSGKFDLAKTLIDLLTEKDRAIELGFNQSLPIYRREAMEELLAGFIRENNLPAVEFIVHNEILMSRKCKADVLTMAASIGGSKMVKVLADDGINAENKRDRLQAKEILERRLADMPDSAASNATAETYLDLDRALAGRSGT